VGWAILDKDDPTKIVARSDAPLLTATLSWEQCPQKGCVDLHLFVCDVDSNAVVNIAIHDTIHVARAHTHSHTHTHTLSLSHTHTHTHTPHTHTHTNTHTHTHTHTHTIPCRYTCQETMVVFSTGLKPLGNDSFYVIYGGADTDVGLAQIKVNVKR
jgi:hypothetical protein